MHTVHFLLFLCFFFVFPTLLVGKGKNLCPKNTFGGVLFFIFYFRHFVAEPGHSLTTSENVYFCFWGKSKIRILVIFFLFLTFWVQKKTAPRVCCPVFRCRQTSRLPPSPATLEPTSRPPASSAPVGPWSPPPGQLSRPAPTTPARGSHVFFQEGGVSIHPPTAWGTAIWGPNEFRLH